MDTLLIELQKAIQSGNWWEILLAIAAFAAMIFVGNNAIKSIRKNYEE